MNTAKSLPSTPSKEVFRPQDLAINGAVPLFPMPLHVGRPNIGSREAFQARIEGMLDDRWLTNNGPQLQLLEQKLSEHLGVRHCVAMCNGTIALEIAIRALGLSGEVIVPSWSFVATAHALSWQGITPVFADIDPKTQNLDPEAVRKMITPRTTGIIGVHLWGRPAPVAPLQDLADEFGLSLMFDAAHAFGCSLQGRRIGGFGRCEVLSFHATKVFNTLEGGAVVTNDDELAATMRLMRNFGFSGYDNVVHPGTNGKMTEVSAAMGLVNLDQVGDFVATNRVNHRSYAHHLDGADGISLLPYNDADDPNFHYIVLAVEPSFPGRRDRVIAALHAENVLARKYFWPGCHAMKPYRELYPHAALVLPHTVSVAEKVLILPNGDAIDERAIAAIASVIKTVAAGPG